MIVKINKTGSVRIKRNIEARLRNHFSSGKAISITYSECVCVALVTECVYIVFSYVALTDY
jgi:hypothetical protein